MSTCFHMVNPTISFFSINQSLKISRYKYIYIIHVNQNMLEQIKKRSTYSVYVWPTWMMLYTIARLWYFNTLIYTEDNIIQRIEWHYIIIESTNHVFSLKSHKKSFTWHIYTHGKCYHCVRVEKSLLCYLLCD